MAYSEEALTGIDDKHRQINHAHDHLLLELLSFQQRLKNEKAKEYLLQGVGRRLKTLCRCIDNIFTIFPPARSEHLSKEELTDVSINLHAFFINIAGVFDNLGWVFVYENNLLGKSKERKISKNGVGLFCTDTQSHLKQQLRDYLNSISIKSWYADYSKIYRDSLAHRIPLYVPPSLLNDAEAHVFRDREQQIQKLDLTKEVDRDKYTELYDVQQKLGRVSHIFAHSLNEGSRPVYFHAQVLADFATVEEVIQKFIEHF